jgi:hypothetical protein
MKILLRFLSQKWLIGLGKSLPERLFIALPWIVQPDAASSWAGKLEGQSEGAGMTTAPAGKLLLRLKKLSTTQRNARERRAS